MTSNGKKNTDIVPAWHFPVALTRFHRSQLADCQHWRPLLVLSLHPRRNSRLRRRTIGMDPEYHKDLSMATSKC